MTVLMVTHSSLSNNYHPNLAAGQFGLCSGEFTSPCGGFRSTEACGGVKSPLHQTDLHSQRVAQSSAFSNSAVLSIRRAAEFLRRETRRCLLFFRAATGSSRSLGWRRTIRGQAKVLDWALQ
jgi:hypothetical protein